MTDRMIERSDGSLKGAKVRELGRSGRRRQSITSVKYLLNPFVVRGLSEGYRRRARRRRDSADSPSRAATSLSLSFAL